MKVAEVRYTGRTNISNRRGPSGESYQLPRGEWVEVEEPEDAERFERQLNLEVEWSTTGQLYARGQAVLDWGYQKKRSLASDLGLDFDGQPDEETLDDSIQEQIEELHDQGEL